MQVKKLLVKITSHLYVWYIDKYYCVSAISKYELSDKYKYNKKVITCIFGRKRLKQFAPRRAKGFFTSYNTTN